jgi:glutamine amidotransferase
MIAVVDYGSGNLHSVAKAFETIGADVRVASAPAHLEDAERVVLPGVGSFAEGMRNLKASGLLAALTEQVLERRKPFLGVCLGMQMLATEGSEEGVHAGLGWIKGRVVPLKPSDPSLKIPHMGWNEVARADSAKDLFAGLPAKPAFYFAHSYRFECAEPAAVAATAGYGGEIVAAVRKDNVFAVQFHPEKSQHLGLMLLRNFLQWKPAAKAAGGVTA